MAAVLVGALLGSLLGLITRPRAVGVTTPGIDAVQEPGTGVQVLWVQDDPAGDDRGAGSLRYPTHPAFHPHKDLLDLRRFAVLREAQHVHFDLTFGQVTNPFSAPEGFYHQRIDIYIDSVPGEGSVQPFEPGPRVIFHPQYAWDWRLRVAPFGGTRLHSFREGMQSPGLARGLTTRLQEDGRTLRVSVPVSVLGVPEPSWRYYVLVGGYDHFGPDEWREVASQAEAWFFSGLEHPELAPRVVDILAPRWGLRSQGRQLGSYDVASGRPALLHPVGGAHHGSWGIALGLALLLVAGLGLSRRWRRRGRRAPE